MYFNDLTKSAKNMMWAGYMFMNTTWIQNQMVYLIVLSKNKQLIDEFVKTPHTLPAEFSKIRNVYWKKIFGEIKKEFIKEFGEHLSDEDLNFIEKIHKLRNMLAHAQVSIGRDYMFYCPADDKATEDFIRVMDIVPSEDSVKPYMIIITRGVSNAPQIISKKSGWKLWAVLLICSTYRINRFAKQGLFYLGR